MNCYCDLPSELEFFQRGFGLSSEHNPSEAVISYIYQYDSGKRLMVSFKPSCETDASITVKILDKNDVIVALSQDHVNDVAFQSWG